MQSKKKGFVLLITLGCIAVISALLFGASAAAIMAYQFGRYQNRKVYSDHYVDQAIALAIAQLIKPWYLPVDKQSQNESKVDATVIPLVSLYRWHSVNLQETSFDIPVIIRWYITAEDGKFPLNGPEPLRKTIAESAWKPLMERLQIANASSTAWKELFLKNMRFEDPTALLVPVSTDQKESAAAEAVIWSEYNSKKMSLALMNAFSGSSTNKINVWLLSDELRSAFGLPLHTADHEARMTFLKEYEQAKTEKKSAESLLSLWIPGGIITIPDNLKPFLQTTLQRPEMVLVVAEAEYESVKSRAAFLVQLKENSYIVIRRYSL